MQRNRFRIILPVIFGVLAVFLFTWQHENDRMVESMGMAWDTGPPVWPYQAVPSFTYAVNAPAYIVSWPILKLLALRTNWLEYVVLFPAVLALWWCVGAYIDLGLPRDGSNSHRRLKAGLLLLTSSFLVFLAAWVCVDQFRWVRSYWKDHPPIYAVLFLGALGSTLWCVFFAAAFARGAIRLLRQKLAPAKLNPPTYRAFLLWGAILGVNAAGVGFLDRRMSPTPDPNHCETDRLYRLGCVHGTVINDGEKPVAHIEVNLIPVFKSGDARRFGIRSEWTDQQGRYNFNRAESGQYILAVNPFESSAGPAKEAPFETRYYRHGDDESGAEQVTVIQPSPTNLDTLNLRRTKFTTIQVTVEWGDGSRPKRSDIFVQNTRYWGLLGGFEEIENGVGKIDLAQDFDYVANAQVECTGRDGPEQRLAVPSQQFKVGDSNTPSSLHLVLVGSPCVLRERP